MTNNELKIKFKFAGGSVWESTTIVVVPVQLGRRKCRMEWQIVEAPIPLLWGNRSMKKSGVLVDIPNDRMRIRGVWTDLIVSVNKH